VQTISEINSKILAGEAKVHTEMELWNLMQSGTDPTSLQVDVITKAFRGGISGSAAMLLVPVTGRGQFTRAEKIWLNGVPGYPGPAPNERLGVVDTLVFVDQVPSDIKEGNRSAKLFLDLLNNREIQVECLSAEGDTYQSTFVLNTLQYARMVTYNTFIPMSCSNEGIDEDGVHDHLQTIRVGHKVLLNKAPGLVIGSGTRGSFVRNSLSLSADMFEMDPECLVEIPDDPGLPIAHSVALPIPVLNESVLGSVTKELSRRQPGSSTSCFHESDEKMAAYLKELVLKKEFTMTDSDTQVLCR
jgi:uncharacterized protein (DUF39 family)